MSDVRYPKCTVVLSERQDGNAFMVMGAVRRALRDHLQLSGMTSKQQAAEVAAFTEEATHGSYDDLLQTCMRWVNVE